MHGPRTLLRRWVEQLELRDVIEILATDLADVLEAKTSPEALYERYPGS